MIPQGTRVTLLRDVAFLGRVFPKAQEGYVVDCLPKHVAVDVLIPDERLVGGYRFDSILVPLADCAPLLRDTPTQASATFVGSFDVLAPDLPQFAFV